MSDETIEELSINDLDVISRSPYLKEVTDTKALVFKKYNAIKEERDKFKDRVEFLEKENGKMKEIFKRNGMDKPVFGEEGNGNKSG